MDKNKKDKLKTFEKFEGFDKFFYFEKKNNLNSVEKNNFNYKDTKKIEDVFAKNNKFSLALKDVEDILFDIAQSAKYKNKENIKWIIVKTLRLKYSQYDFIEKISPEQVFKMISALERLIKGESLSQIFGFVEFHGNIFEVTKDVFDPRLSTEALVDAVVDETQGKLAPKILDLCTGSGCVAITLSKILGVPVDALDVSPFALEIAEKNAKNLHAQINPIQFDLNEPWRTGIKGKFDVIVSNPPYWDPKKILANEEITRNNPEIGFNGGEDGLKYIKIIIENAKNFLTKDGMLFLEIDPDQIPEVVRLLGKHGYKNITISKDHRGIDRVVSAQNDGIANYLMKETEQERLPGVTDEELRNYVSYSPLLPDQIEEERD